MDPNYEEDLTKETEKGMMGASTFGVHENGKTAQGAFLEAVASAQYEYGHRGYTGTIAEKDSFIEIAVPEGEDPIVFAGRLIEEEDPRVDNKWGPAGCVRIAEGSYYFFGWASS